MKDYYSLLNITKTASADEIKKAYRSLARKHHPDKFKDPKEQEAAKKKFQEVQEAYEVLSDPKKKEIYDQVGYERYHQQQQGGGGHGGFQHADFDFSDIFSDIFGQFGGGFSSSSNSSSYSRAERGRDLKYTLEITLEDAFKGISLQIKLPRYVSCGGCKGSGAAKDSKPVTCSTCGGKGRIFVQQMFLNIQQTCHVCGGAGKVQSPCLTCKGQCRVHEKSIVDLKIPAGVSDGITLRLQSQGDAGVFGGRSGDLFVYINIKKHELFSVEGSNIICVVPIDVTTAVLGGIVQAPVIDGVNIDIKIPSGTQHNARIKVPNKGMPFLRNSNRGDMFVVIEVDIPTHLNSNQKELWLQLQKDNNSLKSESFLSKAKAFLSKFGK